MKSNTKQLGMVVVYSFMSLAANAADNGFFVEGGAGRSIAKLGNTAGLNVTDSDTTWLLGAGYNFNKYVGVEVGYRELGIAKASASGAVTGTLYGAPFSATGTFSASADADGVYVGPVFTLPLDVITGLSDKFGISARVGAYRWSLEENASASGSLTYKGAVYAGNVAASAKERGTDAYYGLGGNYNLQKNFGVSLNYNRFRVFGTNVDSWDLRVRYSF